MKQEKKSNIKKLDMHTSGELGYTFYLSPSEETPEQTQPVTKRSIQPEFVFKHLSNQESDPTIQQQMDDFSQQLLKEVTTKQKTKPHRVELEVSKEQEMSNFYGFSAKTLQDLEKQVHQKMLSMGMKNPSISIQQEENMELQFSYRTKVTFDKKS